jgi:hypothetical protein
MKRFFLFFLAVTYANCMFSQSTNTPVRTDYLQKSKNQKTAAWVCLGGGAALIATGFLVGDRSNSSFSEAGTGVVVGGIGFIGTIVSIPLFIASGRNKRKAASVSFKNEMAPQFQKNSLAYKRFPTLSIQIHL